MLQRHNYRPGNDTMTCGNIFLSRETVVYNVLFLVTKFTFEDTKLCYKDIIIDPEMTLRRAETYFLAGRPLSIISCLIAKKIFECTK